LHDVYANHPKGNQIPKINSQQIKVKTAALAKISSIVSYNSGRQSGENLPNDISRQEWEYLKEISRETQNEFFTDSVGILEEILSEDSQDVGWTAEIQSDLIKFVENNSLKNPRVHIVDCRTQLCKVQIDVDSEQNMDEFQKLWKEFDFKKGDEFGDSAPISDRTIRTTIFFSKPSSIAPFLELRERLLDNRNS
jgi:hypothetical protein